MKHLGKLKTVGIDVPTTNRWLRKRYPNNIWMESNFHSLLGFPIDLVIACDVIEHIVNPNDLLSYVIKINPCYFVMLTHDKDLLRMGTYDGPPANSTHIREWNFWEFQAYIK